MKRLAENCDRVQVAYFNKSRQGLDVCLTSVIRAVIGHCPGNQSSTLAVKGRQQMSEIALLHGITLFLGNLAVFATVTNKECVYKWNLCV